MSRMISKIVSGIILCFITAGAVYGEERQFEEIRIDAKAKDGTKYIATTNGFYKFEINSGAFKIRQGGYTTKIMIYTNRNILWSDVPVLPDFQVGNKKADSSFDKAESRSAGKSIIVKLEKDDYVIFVPFSNIDDFEHGKGSVYIDVMEGASFDEVNELTSLDTGQAPEENKAEIKYKNDKKNFVAIGTDVRIIPYSDNVSGPSWNATFNEETGFASVFFDFTYVNISAGYGINTSQPSASFGAGDYSTGYMSFSGISDTFVDFSAYLKYPFGSSVVRFWPAVGFEKVLLINETENGIQVPLDKDDIDVFSPFFLKIGAGLNINAGDLLIMPFIFYCIDLTPVPSSGSLEGLPVTMGSGVALITGISFGFKL
ncbi:MAG: hypothetical protein ABSG94_13130 [Brevinematales bacterium]